MKNFWNPIGWIGVTFLIISGFLPNLGISAGTVKISFLSPLTLLIDFCGYFANSPNFLSFTLLLMALMALICYLAGIGMGIRGLLKWETKSVYHGGIAGLAYSFISFVVSYMWFRVISWNPIEIVISPMLEAGIGFISGIAGSIMMLFAVSLSKIQDKLE